MASLDSLLSRLDWFVVGAYLLAGVGCVVFVIITMLWRPVARILKPFVVPHEAVRR